MSPVNLPPTTQVYFEENFKLTLSDGSLRLGKGSFSLRDYVRLKILFSIMTSIGTDYYDPFVLTNFVNFHFINKRNEVVSLWSSLVNV